MRGDRIITASQALSVLANAARLAFLGIGKLRLIRHVVELTALDWVTLFALAADVGAAGVNLSRIAEINRELDELAERAIALQFRMTSQLERLQEIQSEMIERCFPLRPSSFGPEGSVGEFVDDWFLGR